MLRQSVLQLASRSSVKGIPLQTKTQLPSYLSSRRTLSTSQKNESYKPGSGSNVPGSPSHGPKIIGGGLALGSAILAAYYYGFLDTYLGKEQQSTGDTYLGKDHVHIYWRYVTEITRPIIAAANTFELVRERAKAATSLKSLQEKFEEQLRTELEEKETEAELKLKKSHDLAKADLAAEIASEKASQIEKMAEANLHINALCMAFYARSEEARQSHSVQKLALGALALEDALSKVQPIQKEIEALHPHLEGIDKDSLIALVLSSLPEEAQKYGTDTVPHLNHKASYFKSM